MNHFIYPNRNGPIFSSRKRGNFTPIKTFLIQRTTITCHLSWPDKKRSSTFILSGFSWSRKFKRLPESVFWKKTFSVKSPHEMSVVVYSNFVCKLGFRNSFCIYIKILKNSWNLIFASKFDIFTIDSGLYNHPIFAQKCAKISVMDKGANCSTFQIRFQGKNKFFSDNWTVKCLITSVLWNKHCTVVEFIRKGVTKLFQKD